jgi:uncharacterized protein (DUF433 family)
MSFDPIPFRTIEELREEYPYINEAEWLKLLSFLSKSLEENWQSFKNKNADKWDIFVLAENATGQYPTRAYIAEKNLHPVEEYYYNYIYEYYYKLYETYKSLIVSGDKNSEKHIFNNFKYKLGNYQMTVEEIRACIEYILRNGRYRNTLLALKITNKFAKFHGIRVQDAETVFREWVLDYKIVN